MKRLAVAFSVALFAVACASDRSITITEQNKDAVLDQIKDSKSALRRWTSRSLTPEDVRLLMARRTRVAFASAQKQPGPDWVGKTLEQVIEDERKLEQDAKAQQAEADRLAAAQQREYEAERRALERWNPVGDPFATPSVGTHLCDNQDGHYRGVVASIHQVHSEVVGEYTAYKLTNGQVAADAIVRVCTTKEREKGQ